MKEYIAEVESNAIEYKGKVYFVESQLGAFCCTDLTSKETEIIKNIKCDDVVALYHSSARYSHYAWFFPWQAKAIMCVDLDTFEMTYIDVPHKKCNFTNYGRNEKSGLLKSYPYCIYSSLIRIDDKFIFAVPSSVDTPILLNMETGEIKTYEGIIDVDNERMWGGTIANGKVYMSPFEGKRMIELDYNTGVCKSHKWSYDDYMFGGITYLEDKIWFSPLKSNKLLSFNLCENTFDTIELSNICKKNDSYMDAFVFKNKLWFLPFQADNVLTYNPYDHSLELINKDKEICISYPTELKKIDSISDVILVSCRTGYVCIYNDELELFNNIKVKMSYSKIQQTNGFLDRFRAAHSKDNFYEEGLVGLKEFLQICRSS